MGRERRWDERIGDGNDFQTLVIASATERLLDVRAWDTILDAACGARRFARRMVERGARVVAFDYSAEFIARARERTPRDAAVEYHIVDAAKIRRRPSCRLARTDSTRPFARWPFCVLYHPASLPFRSNPALR
jgi:SAM-dependent methyltransferase